jgi:catechol 2,3-dioxygenase-like lactoylglutathione lyase family enzyme
MSEASKTVSPGAPSVASMNLRPAVLELVVADMPATLAFYRLLGLEIPASADEAPHVEATFGTTRLAFDTHQTIQSFDPDWTPATGGHRVALGFECDSPTDVDQAWKEITDAGYHGHLAPWDAVWGMRYAVVQDPDGTPVDLFAPLTVAS